MTKQRYQSGCAAGSKECGERRPCMPTTRRTPGTSASTTATATPTTATTEMGSCARCVAPVSVRGQEGATFESLYRAWLAARQNKKPSNNQLAFESRWADNLLDLVDQINAGTWSPSPSVCFISTRPKAREIHAPDFSDRVVHHWLIPQLEDIYEPIFIHDCCSNRKGKGTHIAVDRLRQFVRQVHNGQGGGWYLQLDIHNYFNCIHRPTLWQLLKHRMRKSGISLPAQRVAHALLKHSPLTAGVRYHGTAEELACVPAHKRLANSARGCGLPIGNLSSQFFANVYLNELDQYVKHRLKARRYVRYVDDFIIVHRDREQLGAWQDEIAAFLGDALRLKLKPEIKLRPLTDGVDFLGYVVHPTHTRVRRRVIGHARAALSDWAARHVRGRRIVATPEDIRHITSVWSSYRGHMRHANTGRLFQDFRRRFPWLSVIERPRKFHHRLEGRRIHIPTISTEAST